jgi:hypothetical protein
MENVTNKCKRILNAVRHAGEGTYELKANALIVSFFSLLIIIKEQSDH